MVATNVFIEYENIDKSLCQLLLDSTDELYVRYLRHKYIGYSKTTTRALLEHFYTTYAKISASTMQDNNMRLRDPYNSNQPFETLIDQVENVVDYASAVDTTYTPAQVVAISFQLLFQTGLFNDYWKLWRRQPANENIWKYFKELFATDHQEWRESQTTTAGAVFQPANHANHSAYHG